MSLERWLLVLLIVAAGALQYGLVAYSLRDLLRRPRVRGGNKVSWALLILTIPFAGALVYTVFGPTSFLPRPTRPNAVVSAPRLEGSRSTPERGTRGGG